MFSIDLSQRSDPHPFHPIAPPRRLNPFHPISSSTPSQTPWRFPEPHRPVRMGPPGRAHPRRRARASRQPRFSRNERGSAGGVVEDRETAPEDRGEAQRGANLTITRAGRRTGIVAAGDVAEKLQRRGGHGGDGGGGGVRVGWWEFFLHLKKSTTLERIGPDFGSSGGRQSCSFSRTYCRSTTCCNCRIAPVTQDCLRKRTVWLRM